MARPLARELIAEAPNPPRWAILHISERQAERWQALAEVPVEEFEQAIKADSGCYGSNLAASL